MDIGALIGQLLGAIALIAIFVVLVRAVLGVIRIADNLKTLEAEARLNVASRCKDLGLIDETQMKRVAESVKKSLF
jgi:hypothetical protein